MSDYIFEYRIKVRDYECDIQGIVNNANYQHYMEHTRHEFLESLGKNFKVLHDQGIDAVVTRSDIQYKMPLTSGDWLVSRLNVIKEGPRLVFLQDLFREKDNKLCVRGRVEAVVIKDGTLTRGEFFDELLRPLTP